jgi:uncharacterized protein (TIGR03435 family)
MERDLAVAYLKRFSKFVSEMVEMIGLGLRFALTRDVAIRAIAGASALVGLILAAPQPEPGSIHFEVASIRPQAPVRIPNGPLARDLLGWQPSAAKPERMTCTACDLFFLIMRAYDLGRDRISGPNWLVDTRFGIEALAPKGATQKDTAPMLQNLLADRFGLRYHFEKKEFLNHTLRVAARGHKLKEAEEPEAKNLMPGVPPSVDRDGYPIIPSGYRGAGGAPLASNGGMRWAFRGQTISDLGLIAGRELGAYLGSGEFSPARITDETGLTGRYDFRLEFGPSGSRGMPSPSEILSGAMEGPVGRAPDIVTAMEKQLGLTMTKGKIPIDVLVIDNIERAPTEN